MADLIPDAYDSALRWAAEETGMEETDFPQDCEYPVAQILDADFYPGSRPDVGEG